ncbi:MAG: hypothetical protein H7318_05190 [Oligoflexus sp.]|nr:hypothetical protein [Oligoflexus sp.]
MVTAVLLAIVGLYYSTKAPRILLFWIAFVLTRPFGATFGDVLTKMHEKGGLDFGTAYFSLIILGILLFSIFA